MDKWNQQLIDVLTHGKCKAAYVLLSPNVNQAQVIHNFVTK